MKPSRWSVANLFVFLLYFAGVNQPAKAAESAYQYALRLEPQIKQVVLNEAVYEATVNQQADKEVLIVLHAVNGDTLISEKDILRWKLAKPSPEKSLMYNNERYYATQNMPQVRYIFDETQLTADVMLPVSAFNNHIIENQRPIIRPNKPAPGGFVNYDFFLQKNAVNTQVDASLEAGVFNQYGLGIWSSLIRDVGGQAQAVRLDTNWTIDQPEKISSWRIGDAISRGGSVGSSIRFGGLQYATNFGTRPDLVTFPQLSLNGSAVLPSTIDVYLNNIRTFSQRVDPGPFTLNNLPVFTGSGEAKLVVRDLLGREQVITQPYYASRSMLTKGLHDFSYEAGLSRQNYGVASDKYQDVFAAATHRYGFNNNFTAELHGELQPERQQASVGAVTLIPQVGILDASIAVSRDDKRGSGELVSVGYERLGTAFSVGARTQLASNRYSQLGQADFQVGTERLSTVFASWQNATLGSLSVNYINQASADNLNSRILNFNYNRNLFAGWYLSATAFKDLENNQGYQALFNVTKALGKRTSLNISQAQSKMQEQTTVTVQQNLPVGKGFGYRVIAADGDSQRLEASISAQNDVGTYMAEVASNGEQRAYRATMSGGAVMVANHLMFSRRLNDGFAVVDVGGYPNVRVYAENQLVGETDASGMQVIPNLRAYQKNNIAIEPKDIQLDAQIGSTKMAAVPYFRSADYLKFAVQKVRAATLTVRQKNGAFVPSGTLFKVDNDETLYPVAHDGLLYIGTLQARNQLSAQWLENNTPQQCQFELALPEQSDLIPDLGEFKCN